MQYSLPEYGSALFLAACGGEGVFFGGDAWGDSDVLELGGSDDNWYTLGPPALDGMADQSFAS